LEGEKKSQSQSSALGLKEQMVPWAALRSARRRAFLHSAAQITELYSTRPSGVWHILCPPDNAPANLFRGEVSF